MNNCVCQGNWRDIVSEYQHLIGRDYTRDSDGHIFTFFGLVWAEDDFYYGMWNKEDGLILSTCVGYLENSGFTLIRNEYGS